MSKVMTLNFNIGMCWLLAGDQPTIFICTGTAIIETSMFLVAR